MEALLAARPRADVERAIERSQELGAAAFKSKDFKGALGYYDTAVHGLIFLDEAATPLLKALSNRSACHLALGASDKAFNDAADCVKLRPDWQKGWYRLGRALYDQKKVFEAEAAFAEGIQLDLSNLEMQRWRQKARDRMEDVKVAAMKQKRHSTDYSKFSTIGGDDDEVKRQNANIRAPVVDTIEEIHDLMSAKQQAQLDNQPAVDVFFTTDMISLPRAETPAELSTENAFSAMVAYLEQATALAGPKRAMDALGDEATSAFAEAIRHVAANLEQHAVSGDWLHIGAGLAVVVTASLSKKVAPTVTAISTIGAPFAGPMCAALLEANALSERVRLISDVPVESAAAKSGDAGAEVLDRPALILVVDPQMFDEGLLGLRALPYIRHARRALCSPTPLVVPHRARVFAAPVAIHMPPASGFDVGELDRYRWAPFYEDFDLSGSIQAEAGAVVMLAEAQEIFNFDFCAHDVELALPVADSRLLEFVPKCDGEMNGVAFWYELDLVPGLQNTVSNSPRPGRKQALQWIDPVAVRCGGAISLTASHNSTRIRFEVTAPLRLAPCVHRHAISRWHFEMVADELRNQAFDAAIVQAVSKMESLRKAGGESGVHVADFGTGTGLLALMAARAGAAQVTGFDTSGHVVDVARTLVVKNGYEKKVRVMRKDCRQVVMGRDLKHKCDVLVLELFDYGFLGEGALHFIHSAWNNVLKPDAVVVPRGGSVFGCVVQILPEHVEGFDVKAWGAYRFSTDYHAIDLQKAQHRKLTATFRVFDFDFSRLACKDVHPKTGAQWAEKLPVLEDGTANAVVFWHELDMCEGITLSTSPDQARTCWFQACQPIEEVSLSRGDFLGLSAAHEGSRITFQVDRKSLPDYESRRTDVPLFDPLWLQVHNRLQEQGAALDKTLAFNNAARQQATDAIIAISCDAARLARGGRYVHPTQALHFALSL
eukprot:CAMPEP_0184127762 /NCGR_PEP_ID=MMETSP0974-20121125/26236_1 /TAXON_ID=483370 /ORGANISM="non described non described, Strain CCMP2097" /LENGTH=942 /DNA_ID=CAMNT_0026431173 /DNA_START=1 /DNA_END=2826 /DNA_ORIENTATION=-